MAKDKTVLRKADVVKKVVQKTGLSNTQAKEAIDVFLTKIIQGVKKGPVSIPGFGAFRTGHRRARMGRNPRTGESIRIESSTFPVFVPGENLKKKVNKPKKKEK